MEFSLNFEQGALKDAVARWVADSHGFEEARRIAAAGGFSPTHWRQFAELGWLALRVSESQGGLGGSWTDAAIVAEELGRGLVAAPYVASAGLAARLLDAAAAGRPGTQAGALIERLVEGDAVFALALGEFVTAGGACTPVPAVRAVRGAQGFALTGRVPTCLDGGVATDFILPARLEGDGGMGLFHVAADAPGLRCDAYRTIDGRTAADLTLAGLQLPADALLLEGAAAADALDAALDGARLLMAAEAVGIMEAAIEVTTGYLAQRRQFGRPLSSYQVLTHRVADMLVRKEHARSMLYRGLAHLDAEPSARAAAVSATMVAVIERAEFIGTQAIQLHGGIGMTEEYVVGHHYKRLRAIARTWGDHGWHLDRFMAVTELTNQEAAA